eukprot:CAMPEP_0172543706 /NCGR_PEP_ID=MMETSP1067-20121228/14022_1 /TAXON_ID=265564 ORGANISM="Thalassiosira punctigera, Strain Tpunct2005C2" /NCGR_SAMPLE_ID=MMETSP1067 /ASSEMBLY_ACC=CAM_ASM_000444 /LENGTH=36 /DNA_ID= /DNA_START= /DNA_END= /DNA_ORIENTATION=
MTRERIAVACNGVAGNGGLDRLDVGCDRWENRTHRA